MSQYVTAYYGIEDSGVGFVDEIRTSEPDEFWLRTGAEDNPLVELDEAQAQAGDVNAQLQMARRYYWGNQGLEPNVPMARHWYERAVAEHDNPEANYNLGVLHNNGQGGFPVNQTKAMELFRRAAHPQDPSQEPFHLALHALGNHYLHSQEKNVSLAVSYLTDACDLGSPDAHYAMAVLYVSEEEYGDPDIETAMVHLVQASNALHVRAMNFLAHGLYDPDSWLNVHARRLIEMERRGIDSTSPHSWPDTSRGRSSKWRYDPAYPLEIMLPSGIVRIPQPLGRGNGIPAAMHLLKFLSAMSYRINDLLRAGSGAYNNGDDVAALEHFSEAAELGLPRTRERRGVAGLLPNALLP